jgi:hypothetical protein
MNEEINKADIGPYGDSFVPKIQMSEREILHRYTVLDASWDSFHQPLHVDFSKT